MCVYPPYIPNIEQLSQLTISSLGSESFGRKIYDVNIQQQNASGVNNIDTVMSENEELDPSTQQDI